MSDTRPWYSIEADRFCEKIDAHPSLRWEIEKTIHLCGVGAVERCFAHLKDKAEGYGESHVPIRDKQGYLRWCLRREQEEMTA